MVEFGAIFGAIALLDLFWWLRKLPPVRSGERAVLITSAPLRSHCQQQQ